MSKELIVSLNGREKKIAIIEDDVVTEFYVERGDENQGIVGNIYKGKVMKVLPGMQSAFVDIGLERDAFLYVSDFVDDEDFEGAFQEDRKEERRPARAERSEKPRSSRTSAPGAPPVIEVEPEEDEEAALEALSHIEELSEEPVIERETEDESEQLASLEAAIIEPPVAVESPRDRRRQRLQYVEPESEKEEAAAEVIKAPAAKVAAAVEADDAVEVPEEGAGRRRRRPRSKRGRGDAPVVEAVESLPPTEEVAEPVFAETPLDTDTDSVETPAADITEEPAAVPAPVAQVFEPTPLAEPGEPMERVNDDDLGPVSARALAQPEELVLVKLEVEPTPEVHVGSLQTTLQGGEAFERISDDEAGAVTVEDSVAPAPERLSFSTEEEVPSSDEIGTAATAEQGEYLAPLPDASAELREKKSRAEFATRRGGRGRRRRLPAGETATTETDEEKNAEPESESAPPAPSSLLTPANGGVMRHGRPVISDLLREGQEVLVQIAKEPIGQKGARITSHIVLPGRYVVYMPTVDHIGVSRKIGTDEERQRLKRTLNQLRAENNIPGGFIVRTAAANRTVEELRDDVQYLGRTWSDMRRRADRSKAPAVVHRDLDLVQRILRDQLSSDFTAIRVDNEFEYERIVDFVNRFAPKLIHRVKLYTKDNPILDEYGVQAEIDKAVKPRVWLKSGGYIVINQTEALVAIDVNTGKFVGRSNRLEDTIVKTNLEAAKEIARQIRLRDLGGIIILDFIDMEERRNRQRVMQALEIELRHDKSPSKILQFNDFGLVAITRKRVKQSLERTLCTPCSYCGGGGMVKSAQTMCYELLAEARRVAKHDNHHSEVILRVNPEVAKALRTTERDIFIDIEAHFSGVVTIKSDPTVHQEQFDIALV
ncbi:MAG TPA: Rne/Rng family ribonuclease [Blastocatellia bacterium]|nr:Rne/Rng family ribonuclease [Blastocatellia bacterium]